MRRVRCCSADRGVWKEEKRTTRRGTRERRGGRGFHAEGEGGAAHGGVDWLKAGDRRRRAWPEAKEEKKNRGSRVGDGKRKKKNEDREGGRGFTVPRLLFAHFSFFLIQFYHKTSTYCINNRIAGPLIINRIPKYNRWSAY